VTPPVFTTPPAQAAAYIGERYRHDVVATDPDPNDAVTIDVASGPSGLAYSPAAGQVGWTPALVHVPQQSFVLRALDLGQNATLQGSTLPVRTFSPPQFTSVPQTNARPDELYVYAISTSDPDLGDTVQVTLQSGPPGLALVTGPALEWTPSMANLGTHPIVLEARDERGARTTQAFNLVIQVNEAPVFTSSPPVAIEAGNVYAHQVLVTDDGPSPLNVALVEGPFGMSLSGSNGLSWATHFGDEGRHAVVVRATDALGLSSDLSFELVVRSPETGNQVPSNTYCDPVASWSPAWSQIELEAVAIVNQVRSEGADCGSRGYFEPAAPLVLEPTLRCAARVHAEDMFVRDFFDHTNPDGQGPGARAALAGYPSPVAENLSMGSPSASEIIDGLLASDGHCANLMDPSSEAIGIGYHPGGGEQVDLHVQVFGTEATGNRPPVFAMGAPKAILADDRLSFYAAATDPEGEAVTHAMVVAPSGVTLDPPTGLVEWRPTVMDLGEHSLTVQATDASGASAFRTYPILVLTRTLPPDPATIAPPLSKVEIHSFFDQVSFLWTSSPAVQPGIDASILDQDAIAVIRGGVRVRDGGALSGVRVRVAHRPELGFTLTRPDGRFDLAVLGGGQVVLEYELAGYVPAERTIDVPWSDYVEAPEVALVPYDTAATQLAFGSGTSMQVAQATPAADTDGARRATLLFPSGTEAEMILANGAHVPLALGTVRATELTVGPDGPDAMPAELPLGTGYTYAVELSVDEAIAAGATGVEFSQPVPLYVENFLGFPVGGQVPIGYYDRSLSTWVPEDDGRIVEILGVTGGLADLDVDGSGQPASGAALSALAITVEEQERLAQLYAVGDTLWRVRLPHFSYIDLNWPSSSPCVGECPVPPIVVPQIEHKVEDDCERSGSIIECQNQTLGESLGVTGTGMTLDYRSDRVPGRQSAYTIEVPIGAVPPTALAVRIEITVAGRVNEIVLPPTPNQTYSHVWDGRDAYGRIVLGKRTARVRVAYDYPAQFTATQNQVRTFGLPGLENNGALVELRPGRRDLSVWRAPVLGEVGTFDARAAGLGGWTLSAHHLFDPVTRTVYFGDGSERKLPSKSRTALDHLTFGFPRHVDVDAKGRLYVADPGSHVVWRVDPQTGAGTIIAGTGVAGFSGDGGPATMANLNTPHGVAVDGLGNVYIADMLNHRIRRVRRNGVIETVAGTGQAGFDGEVGVAPLAKFDQPREIEVGPDGSLYVVDFNNDRIRRIRPGATPSGFGMVVTAVGGKPPIATGPPVEGMYALRAILDDVYDIAVNGSGDIYFVMWARSAVFRVRNDRIEELAGCETAEGGADCELDPTVALDGRDDAYRLYVNPWGLALDGDDVLLTDGERDTVWRVTPERRAYHLAGGSPPSWSGNGPRTEPLDLDCATDAVMGPDRAVYIVAGCGGGGGRIHAVGAPVLYPPGDVDVVSQDGSAIFRFTEAGRHIATIDTVTAQTLLTFGYTNGYLTSITDAFANTTSIVRSASGVPEKIVAPFGQETLLFLDANEYLREVRDPSLASYRYGYTPLGLMDLFTDPMGTPGAKQYVGGRLTRDDDGGGGFQTLAHAPTADGYRVDRTTAMGRTTRFEIEQKPDGTSLRTVVSSNGVVSVGETKSDGTVEKVAPNGVRTMSKQGPGPRFGMDAPMVVETITEMPSGLRMVVTQTAAVALADPDDPLTMTWSQSVVSVNGRTSTTTYVAATRTVTTVSPAGRVTESLLDGYGRTIESRVPGLLPVFTRYDGRGRAYETQQGTRITTSRFRPDGYVDEVEDALGHITKITPDAVGRPTIVQGPDGRTMAFDYDLNGNRVELTPPFRPGHVFVHDPRNLETEYRPPPVPGAAMPTVREYDLDQDPSLVTLPDGRQIGMVYLPNGVLDRVTTPDGDIVFAYDAVTGEVQSITAPSGVVTTYVRDGDLVTDVIYSGLLSASVHHEHDDHLRVIREDVNGGSSIPFAYDADGIATQVGAMTLVPRADNGLPDSTAVGVVTDAYGYNGYGEPDSYAASAGGVPIYERSDVRDGLGRLEQTTETIDGATDVFDYDYDLPGRIEEVRRNGILEARYGYDGNDNRVAVTDLSGTRTATVDDQDRLLAFGDFTYAYNATGQLATKNQISTGVVTNYAYDVKTNLLTVDILGGDRIDYAVDGTDRRVARYVNGVLDQTYIWASDSIVASFDGGVFTRYVYGTSGEAPDYFVRSGSTYRLVKDGRGSVRLVVDATTGVIAQRLDYGPFGEVLLDTNPGFQPFAYAGGLYDPVTGLVRFGARDYDAYAGRWTAKDPSGFQETGSLYVYVGNDPINLVDPTGMVGLLGAGLSFGGDFLIELAFQLLESGFDLDCLDFGEAFNEALTGAALGFVGVGVLKTGTKAAILAARLGPKLPKLLAKLKRFIGCLTPCFAPGTLVETVDGLRPIEEIAVGDLVLAMDEATGEQAYKEVLEVIVTGAQPLIELGLVRGDGSESVQVTPEHPFWAQGLGWLDAGALDVGDHVFSLGLGWTQVTSKASMPGDYTVYNLTVADYATYSVGEQGAWVHNCRTPGGRLLSEHAKESLRRHGFDLDNLGSVDDIIEHASRKYEQKKDGAMVFVKKVGKKYDVIVEGADSIVTGFKAFSRKDLRKFAKKYGWELLP
jgi:RHS repeat-associated protein